MNEINQQAKDQFVNHLIELRKRALFIIIGLVICILCLIPFCNDIYQIIAAPITKYLPANTQLIATEVIAPFSVPIKLAILIAVFISLPNTIYQIWRFISPALYKQEKLIIFSVVVSSILLFVIGVLFCYFLVLPAIFHFISNFKMEQITMMADIDKYLGFILSLFMIFGLAFETPVLVFLLIHFNILTINTASKIRKYVFVGCFIVAAIVTPPDVFSQTMLALPLYLLYELGIIASKLFIRQPAAVE